MRKEKKFAWIAGGALVAVMAVYLIMTLGTGGNHNDQPVELVGPDSPDASQVTQVQSDNVAESQSTDTAAAGDIPAANITQSGTAIASTANTSVAPGDMGAARGKIWGTLLETGTLPDGLLMTTTPRVDSSAPVTASSAASLPDASSDMPDTGSAQANAPLGGTSYASSANSAGVSANTARTTGPRTHTVRNGETLSSIAGEIYGRESYWTHIARANPNVNPNRLKVGTILTIPAPAVVTAGARTTQAEPAAAPVDPTRQYRVQANDSLYKIALKLYGSSTYVDQIYELNKQTIGSDPARLKLNMVLQLPKPPTQSAQ